MRGRVLARVVSAATGVLVLVATVAVVGAVTSPVGAQEGRSVSWQSAGDSFSSGEGVQGNAGACAQSQEAYGKRAAAVLRERGWSMESETFTACTGHLVEDYFLARPGSERSLWEWGREQGGPERVDVVTLSFGGNDVGFSDVVKDCLYFYPDGWGSVNGDLGCDVTEGDLRARVDALVDPDRGCSGTRLGTRDSDRCALLISEGRTGSIVDFYFDVVSQRLTDQGRLYVVGYPALFAPAGEWPWWSWSDCWGVTRGDADMLGRISGHMNEKLKEAVRRANEALGGERVVFVDRYQSARDGRHELCGSGDDWLNGVHFFRGDGGVRTESSFHPNGAGHRAIGDLLAVKVAETLPSEPASSPTWEEIKDTEIPSVCGHPPTTLVDGRHTGIAEGMGMLELNQTLYNGEPALLRDVPSDDFGPLTAVVATCNAGGVGFPNEIVFFGSGGEYYASTNLDDGDWESLGLYGPARDGVEALSLVDGRVEVLVSAYTPDDAMCCPTSAAIAYVRAVGGEVPVEEVVFSEPPDDEGGDGVPPECTEAILNDTPLPDFCPGYGE